MRTVARGLIAIALLVVIGASPAPAAAGIRTQARIFRPFNAAGRATLRVQSRSGYCFTGSLAINRRNAWRCLVGNFLYDPCFSAAWVRGVVICPNLRLNGGVRIRLTRALPRRFARRGAPSLARRPWAIQLVNGTHCVYEAGSTNVFRRVRLNYVCGGSNPRYLWGGPNRRVQPWLIRSAPFMPSNLSRHRLIRRAWM